MHHKSIGFIGGGRITRIFLAGWARVGKLPANIVVSDCNADALARIKAKWPEVQTASANAAAAGQDIVFLAVHPPVLAEVCGGIKGALKPGALVVSLAPRFTVAKLTGLLGGFGRIARVIPNAPSIIGAGYNPVCFAASLTESDKSELKGLLEPLGECPEVAEEKLEAYAVITAMGPTCLCFQLQALREVAAGFGLRDAEIVPALKRMVCGSARTLLESGLTPPEVMDLIPLKPLTEMEAHVNELYRARLPAIYQKIKP